MEKEPLTFDRLRKANLDRAPEFKNSKGVLTHPNGISDWSPEQWLEALTGEVGEYANFHKKFVRGDIDAIEFLENAKKELADVQIYLDLLSARLGIDLGRETMRKFNKVSDKVGSSIKL